MRPVVRDLLADLHTPVSAYWKLAHDEQHSFLLESVTGGEQLARYSILGVRPRSVLTSRGDQLTESDGRTSRLESGEDPLHALERRMPQVDAQAFDGLPKFCAGAVGMLGYDLVRFFERLPDAPPDDLGMPDMAMMLCESVVVFDHAKSVIRIVVLAEPDEKGYDAASREIDRIVSRLLGPLPALPPAASDDASIRSNMTPQAFMDGVDRVKEYIAAGDGIQMVLSQRFETSYTGHPLTLYRALRTLNPSPYMFLLRFDGFDVVGASPEILVGLTGRTARVRPIAGTRRRGSSAQEDAELESELLADEKERAEHIMLVDLGRNDLGRVCRYGSVKVNDLMVVERYSHVMHIVSDVTGALEHGKDAYDLIRATFPAGTVSGAPKVRAMQIIDELEPTRRGLYAGAVGYLGVTGDIDLAIAIRTVLLKGGKAYVQAGAGLVYDSVPAREHQECRDKANAALSAIRLAGEPSF